MSRSPSRWGAGGAGGAAPDLSGYLTKSDAAVAYQQKTTVTTPGPQPTTSQFGSGRTIIGVFGNTLISWSQFGINQSDDGGTTWSAKSVPADVTTAYAGAGKAWMVAFKGNWYLSCLNNAGVASVYRTPIVAAGAAFSWSSALVTGGTGAAVFSSAFSTDGSWLYWGEYGDPSGGPKLRRSSDGTTWTTTSMATFFARHIHGIFPDPYTPGQVWMTGGDTGSAAYHLRSTDYGATWAALPGALGTNGGWQSVQVSFDATTIYLAPDSPTNWTAARVDRATLTPRWFGQGSHRNLPVPHGMPPRRITDLVTTAGSTGITSSSAAFTSADVGAKIRTIGQNFVAIGTYIAGVSSATAATLNTPAPLGVNGATAILGGEAFGAMAYYGAIDPATGIYYFVTINGGVGGNVDGLFAMLRDGTIVLLDLLGASPDAQVVIDPVNSRVYVQGFYRPLLAA